MPKTETDIAVLQVQVKTLNNDVSEIKASIKEINILGVTHNEIHKLLTKCERR
jgi:hypothetical protein